MEYRDYTDTLIENFFEQNQNVDDDKFFSSLESNIKSSQTILDNELNQLTKENLISSQSTDNKKNKYSDKLEEVTMKYNQFEQRTENLNSHYIEKISYISALSKNLEDFENFKKNIEFALKIFNYISFLNSSEDIAKVLPDIFTDSDKMLHEGVEVYEAFRQIIDVCRDYPIFVNHFKNSIDAKFQETLKMSIKEFYDNNEFIKLEKLMKVTSDMSSEFVYKLYVSYAIKHSPIETVASLLSEINYSEMNEFKYTEICKIMKNFHDEILKVANEQFGNASSKVYLIFPEIKYNNVIGELLTQISQRVDEFRNNVINESGKSDEVYVKLIEYLYPLSDTYIEKMKESLIYSKTDLWNHIEQETNLFLRHVESIYMFKEKNLLDQYQNEQYYEKVKAIVTMNKKYNEKDKNKVEDKTKNKKAREEEKIEELQNSIFDLIDKTNLATISKHAKTTITRYINLLKVKEEKKDMIATFCKNILDAVKNLLDAFCNIFVILLKEREKNNLSIINIHFHYFSRIKYLKKQLKNGFLYEMKDFMKVNKDLFEGLEELVGRQNEQIGLFIDKVYGQFCSFITGNLNLSLKALNNENLYHIKKLNEDDEFSCSKEFEEISNQLRMVFAGVNQNYWSEGYKNKILQLITKILVEKLLFLLLNVKINENGLKVLKRDFNLIRKDYYDFLEKTPYYEQVNDLILLIQIFYNPIETLNEFVETLPSDKFENKELLKSLVKKRKHLNL